MRSSTDSVSGWSRNPRASLGTMVGHRSRAMLTRRRTRRVCRSSPHELRAVLADAAADPQVVPQDERQRLVLPVVRVDRMVRQPHGDLAAREPRTVVPCPDLAYLDRVLTWPTSALALRIQPSPVTWSTRRLNVRSPMKEIQNNEPPGGSAPVIVQGARSPQSWWPTGPGHSMRNVHAPAREKPLARLSSAKTWRCATCGWAVTVIASTQRATFQVSQVDGVPGVPGNGYCCTWCPGSFAWNRKSKHR